MSAVRKSPSKIELTGTAGKFLAWAIKDHHSMAFQFPLLDMRREGRSGRKRRSSAGCSAAVRQVVTLQLNKMYPFT
jgi:hypothetical protein